ncbi:EpsG family protein [Empedobacter falsenii]|uniref:EpsG family protein n=1 Tax=Empedobacter falsenii TaxID=343874 RepID=UPI003A8032AE
MALPTILLGIIKKSKFSLTLFILFLGILSYLYIPNYSDDKSRYIEIYEDFKNWDYIPFILYNLSNSQDFILQLLFKAAADIGIKVQIVFFITTVISVGILLKIWSHIVIFLNLNKKESLLSLFLFITAISYLDLFSGTRFMLAASIALYAYFQGFFLNKNRTAILLLLICVNIHFGLLVFAFTYIFIKLTIHKAYMIKTAFLFSFVFLLLPKDFLVGLFSSIGLGGALASKSEAYITTDNDFVTQSVQEGGFGGMVIYLVQNIWIYAMYIYLLIRIKSKQQYHLICFFLITVFNLFYSIPTVYLRYSLFIKMFFVVVLLFDIHKYKIKKEPMFFIASFICILITQIIVMRYNIDESYMKENSFFFIDILFKKPMSSGDLIY